MWGGTHTKDTHTHTHTVTQIRPKLDSVPLRQPYLMFGDGLEQLGDRHVRSNHPQEDPVVSLDAPKHFN